MVATVFNVNLRVIVARGCQSWKNLIKSDEESDLISARARKISKFTMVEF